MQSISNLYLSPPIACPSFPSYGILEESLYFYTNLIARASLIYVNNVSEQTMIERLRKKKERTRELGNRSEGRERFFFSMKGNEFSRDLYNAIRQTHRACLLREKKILMKIKTSIIYT